MTARCLLYEWRSYDYFIIKTIIVKAIRILYEDKWKVYRFFFGKSKITYIMKSMTCEFKNIFRTVVPNPFPLVYPFKTPCF